MLRPDELASELPHGPWSCRGCDVWDTIRAAAAGDVAAPGRLLERDPNLYREEDWYTQPIHFAVREGHLEAVQFLLDAGAAPGAVGLRDDLVIMARDRGHEAVALLLEAARGHRGSTTPAATDHAIHLAAATGDLERVRELLDAHAQLVHCIDRAGSTPLHRAVAVAASAREIFELLLDRGADIHADRVGDPAGICRITEILRRAGATA